MTAPEREPTPGQLLSMAYVDGELAEPARREFEDRQRREPELAREVAELKALKLLVGSTRPEAQDQLARHGVAPVQLVVEHGDGADVVATGIEHGVVGVTRRELA